VAASAVTRPSTPPALGEVLDPAAVAPDGPAGAPTETLAGAHPPWRTRLRTAVQDRLPPTLRAARWTLDARSVLVVCVIGVIAVLAALLLFGTGPRTEAVTRPTFEAASTAASVPGPDPSGPTATPTVPAVLVVHVAGLVARPGVYALPAGSRVVDAIAAAGGAIEGTDLSQLNLARTVVDGEQVAVGVPSAPAGPADTGPAAPVTQGGPPLDLNLATEVELDSLPGVGPVLAARIVAWREANGRFSSVQELLEVSGIGAATLADVAPLVRV